MLSKALGLIAVMSGLLVTAGPAGAQTVSTTAAGRVSSEGPVAAWSEPYRTPSGSRRFRLVTRTEGAPPRVIRGLPSRGVPFDVDLGRDVHGRIVALYSRCRSEAASSRDATTQPDWDLAEGCAVYEAHVSSGRERRLRSVDGRGEPFLPSRSGPRVVFGRRTGPRVGLRMVDLRSGRQRQLSGGTAGAVSDEFDDFPEFSSPGPLSVDLRGHDVLFSWALYPDECPFGATISLQSIETEIWVQRVGSRGRRLASGCSTSARGLTEVAAPVAIGSRTAYRATTGLGEMLTHDLRCTDAAGTRSAGSIPRVRSLAGADDVFLGLVADLSDDTGPRTLESLAVDC